MTEAETYIPESLDEVAALLLAADGPDSPVITGARCLVRTSAPAGPTSFCVDMGRVPELNRVEFDERNGLLIGAAVSLAEPLRFPPVQKAYPILADSRNPTAPGTAAVGATVGECFGNHGQAASADLVLPLVCLGASVAIFGPHGWSEMSVEALCARRTGRALHAGEFIVDVRVPAPVVRSGGAYVRADYGGTSDGSIGAAALLLMQDDPETCCGARLAVRWEGSQSARVPDAERFLQGRHLDRLAVEEAAGLVAETSWLPNPMSPDVSRALKAAARQAIRMALDRSLPRPGVARSARRV